MAIVKVSEIDTRLSRLHKLRVRRGNADAAYAELLVTMDLINLHVSSELLPRIDFSGKGRGRRAQGPTRDATDSLVARLKGWIARIKEVLEKIARALGASGWTISAGFPANFSVAISFSFPQPKGRR